MYEFRLNRRMLLSASVSLALALSMLFLAGFLGGFRWASEGEWQSVASEPRGPTPEDSPPSTLVSLARPVSAAEPDGRRAAGAVPIEHMAAAAAGRETSGTVRLPRPWTGPPYATSGRSPRHRDLRFRPADPVPLAPYGELIYRAARRHRMSPDLVAAIVWVESRFDPRAVSNKGARGLMQIMPETGRRFGVEVEGLFDPERNLDAGVRYLRWLSERYAGDLALTLGAYNAGEAAVDRFGQVPPYPETRSYVRQVYATLGLFPQAERVPGGVPRRYGLSLRTQ